MMKTEHAFIEPEVLLQDCSGGNKSIAAQRILTQRLEEQQQGQRWRERRRLTKQATTQILYHEKKYLSFSSNDYLGLASHPNLIRALQESAAAHGVGSTSSALVAGYHNEHQEFELAFSEYLGRDRAIFFGNGYMANLGVITALMQQRNDIIYQDKLNHASMIDAALLSKAQLIRYPHHHLDKLEILLQQKSTGLRLIASESVFSMDGSVSQWKALAQLAAHHEALLMLDDAHGIGVLGPQGKSVAASLTQQECPLIICPLGKAFGCYGAIVAGSNLVMENILQFARSYTYTTAPPPALAAAGLSALALIQTEEWRREKLQQLIHYFQKRCAELGLLTLHSSTAIQSIVLGSSTKAQQLSHALLMSGIFVRDIRPPTVPEGTARLRITLTAHHSNEDIDRLLVNLKDKQHEII